jgi:uncharacterized protein YaiI (UPF0178 family)
MKVLVDADACPVKEINVRLAKKRHIPITMMINTAHQLDDGYSEVITVDRQLYAAGCRVILSFHLITPAGGGKNTLTKLWQE